MRHPLLVDLWSALAPEDRKQVESGDTKTLYVAICYRECPIDPVRPVVPDACGGDRRVHVTASCATPSPSW